MRPYALRKLSPPLRGTTVELIVDVTDWMPGAATVQVTVVEPFALNSYVPR